MMGVSKENEAKVQTQVEDIADDLINFIWAYQLEGLLILPDDEIKRLFEQDFPYIENRWSITFHKQRRYNQIVRQSIVGWRRLWKQRYAIL